MKRIPERLLLPLVFVGGLVIGLIIVFAVLNMQRPETAEQTVTPSAATPSSTVSEENEKYPETSTSTEATSTVDVSWLAKPVLVPTADARKLLSTFATDTSMFDRMVGASTTASATNDPMDEGAMYNEAFVSLWKMGTVTSFNYDGAGVYLLTTSEDMPGGNFQNLIIVFKDKALFPVQYSPEGESPFARFLEHVTNISIPSLDTPETVSLANGKTLTRVGAGFANSSFFNEVVYLLSGDTSIFSKIAVTKDGKQLYGYPTEGPNKKETTGGCLYTILPNGQLVKYQSEIPMKAPGKNDRRAFVPDVVWNKGYENTALFTDQTIGGCGAAGCTDVVTDPAVGPTSTLVLVGKVASGDGVYAPAAPATNASVKAAYDNWLVVEGTKPSISAFVQKHPLAILFWRDAVGRWVRLTTADIIPAAECGKPVIYLYPPSTTNVSVKLPPFINVTKSEPAYPSNGWNVVAHPDGSLSYADGKTYGSLYWEGTGVVYDVPKEGFILKDGEVDARLTEILSEYGLNANESKEFRDFWVPKMTGAPYYRVSFLTNDWSNAAPLFVSPRPATSIRIFMDWQKLNAPMSINAPEIVTPSRNGFTLVEWGGLLR